MNLRRYTIAITALIALWMSLLTYAYAQDWTYTTRPGDTLWDISKTYLKKASDYTRIQTYNNISEPRLIPPGTRIRLPYEWMKKQPIPAQVVHIRQPVEFVLPGSLKPEVLNTLNTKLHNGTEIRTGAQGSVTLRFADGSTLLVQSETTLILDAVSSFNKEGMVDTRVRLQQGRIDTKVTPFTNPKSRYEITTPAAVAAVRGTSFRVNADSKLPIMRSEVLGGNVAVSGARVTQNVNAGFGAIAEAGKPPQPPVPLLPPPDSGSFPTNFNRLPISFTWQDLAGAKAYRLQLARDQSFERVVFDELVINPSINIDTLEDGDYALRLRGIDKYELEGQNVSHAFSVDTKLKTPSLVTPVNSSVHRNTPIDFSWDAQPNATVYYFQLSQASTFSTLILKQSTSEPSFNLTDKLLPGVYYWRVAAENTRHELGDYSEQHSLTILAPPSAPLATSHQNHQGNIIIRWPALSDVAQYQLQLSHDAAFNNVFIDEIISDTSYTLSSPNGIFYYRVKSIATDGTNGAYSAVQQEKYTHLPAWPMLIIYILALLL